MIDYNDFEEDVDNLNKLKLQAEKYEDEAKRQELLMRVKGNKKYGKFNQKNYR